MRRYPGDPHCSFQGSGADSGERKRDKRDTSCVRSAAQLEAQFYTGSLVIVLEDGVQWHERDTLSRHSSSSAPDPSGAVRAKHLVVDSAAASFAFSIWAVSEVQGFEARECALAATSQTRGRCQLRQLQVMLDAQGYLKLIDFGIAKKLPEGESKTFTMSPGMAWKLDFHCNA